MKQLIMVLMATVLVTILTSCASSLERTANQQEELLLAAGFSKKPANTPEKMARLKRLPLYEIAVRRKNTRPVYYYADPNTCQCLYVGNESNYQAYRRLLIQRNMSSGPVAVTPQNMEAEEEWGVWGSE